MKRWNGKYKKKETANKKKHHNQHQKLYHAKAAYASSSISNEGSAIIKNWNSKYKKTAPEIVSCQGSSSISDEGSANMSFLHLDNVSPAHMGRILILQRREWTKNNSGWAVLAEPSKHWTPKTEEQYFAWWIHRLSGKLFLCWKALPARRVYDMRGDW